ncbi:MAG: hypothetical protein A6D92_18470 [Symbiobacterium thermophilum]|uniref:Uncharacterized protein n=1 Tax=Symbiobacterium thermophilum TaxID=2734 RepID=A0A1Y2T1N0_SYMTR|nr:MAG: hypothetical protein A6D92_18470 [Symbiobacterium thermophilum]
MLRAMIRAARQPKKQTAPSAAGAREIRTSRMMRAVDTPAHRCGLDATSSSPFSVLLMGYPLPPAAARRPSSYFASRIDCTSGRRAGQT